MPHKKLRKKLLSDEQKEENQIISSYRIKVEHAICGIKRLRCLTDVFR
ncbi:MAG: transposase family protein, partial [Oscillospiraceae bacterium]|nr:transposase family protein [Oscillospiraceae bacterium]